MYANGTITTTGRILAFPVSGNVPETIYVLYVVIKFPVQGLMGFPSNFLCSSTAV